MLWKKFRTLFSAVMWTVENKFCEKCDVAKLTFTLDIEDTPLFFILDYGKMKEGRDKLKRVVLKYMTQNLLFK